MKKLIFFLLFTCAFLTKGISQECDLTTIDVSTLKTGKNLVCTSNSGISFYAIVRNGKIKDYEAYAADGTKLEAVPAKKENAEPSAGARRPTTTFCLKCYRTADGTTVCIDIKC